MFGAVVREYYKNPENNAGKKLVSVSIMPCTAKKEEILRPESKTNGRQDIDYVLTTTELISMISGQELCLTRLKSNLQMYHLELVPEPEDLWSDRRSHRSCSS